MKAVLLLNLHSGMLVHHKSHVENFGVGEVGRDALQLSSVLYATYRSSSSGEDDGSSSNGLASITLGLTKIWFSRTTAVTDTAAGLLVVIFTDSRMSADLARRLQDSYNSTFNDIFSSGQRVSPKTVQARLRDANASISKELLTRLQCLPYFLDRSILYASYRTTAVEGGLDGGNESDRKTLALLSLSSSSADAPSPDSGVVDLLPAPSTSQTSSGIRPGVASGEGSPTAESPQTAPLVSLRRCFSLQLYRSFKSNSVSPAPPTEHSRGSTPSPTSLDQSQFRLSFVDLAPTQLSKSPPHVGPLLLRIEAARAARFTSQLNGWIKGEALGSAFPDVFRVEGVTGKVVEIGTADSQASVRQDNNGKDEDDIRPAEASLSELKRAAIGGGTDHLAEMYGSGRGASAGALVWFEVVDLFGLSLISKSKLNVQSEYQALGEQFQDYALWMGDCLHFRLLDSIEQVEG
ncbi:hypothetical protein B484DRAFT_446796 [Ochromonadaceae sp. CCMP2298]|nr:hypothetical protein B484DRAFT_446796 [Ochromonadaceae sp. CCMP2298]|mmetsp:Transcript_16870/g.37464  ORF Transcript_16870/g.37464 Transcript_16870/m.37464 type:complete len:463 (-) Transcript_16870:25-1413(-)|eukprot:CAMPEP_0173193584 /NCGR_PEP_ID=MMETSP1141-20130122/14029_1 /TAXON_ID=483371 /ORGANISM="non described non described, Strain CCMP2298" /LENGTH=462 /DNA_ID=CAMNT_0014117915 /DNA_START=82 /DNA_END=1470 /DNA_ORIENTATION=+